MSKTERKQYEDSMFGLSGFGQVLTPTGCPSPGEYILSLLRPLVADDIEITWEELNKNVQISYENKEELNLTQGKSAYTIAAFSDKTQVYAISTGYHGKAEEGAGNLLYACFYRCEDLWIGVHFATEAQILRETQASYMGKLRFSNLEKKVAFLKSVEQCLLPGETWSFDQEGKLEILEQYLTNVSYKLYEEYQVEGSLNQGKLIFSEDESMVLCNTGLLNKFTGDIPIIGSKFSFETGGFLIDNPFLVTGAKDLTRNGFDTASCPEKASFFTSLEELVFKSSQPILLDDVKLGEIIEEAAERASFPEAYDMLCQAGAWATMTGLLKTAIEKAHKIGKNRCNYVIPRYAPSVGSRPCSVQFMMPIYLQTDLTKEPDFLGSPDFVLVLQEGAEGYVPESIIKLAEAYHSGKLITTPDNSWLQGEGIVCSPRENRQLSLLSLQKNTEEMLSWMIKEVNTNTPVEEEVPPETEEESSETPEQVEES